MVRAMMDAGHPFMPMAGEGENGFRKLIAEHSADGLKGSSAGQSPALVAISMKAAHRGAAGQSRAAADLGSDPQVEDPNFKDGENYWSDLTDNFFAANEFPPCGVSTSPRPEIMAQTRSRRSSDRKQRSCASRAQLLPSSAHGGSGWSETAAPFFRMPGCRKRYGGVRALEDVEFDLPARPDPRRARRERRRQVDPDQDHAGVVQPDDGRMELDGRAGHASPSPAAAKPPASSASSRNCR